MRRTTPEAPTASSTYTPAGSPATGTLANLLVLELGHLIGIEKTDVRTTRIPGTDMVDVNYASNGFRYRKNQLNGTPVLVPQTRATTPDASSVFAVGGPAYGPAAASFNAKDVQVLRLLYGK